MSYPLHQRIHRSSLDLAATFTNTLSRYPLYYGRSASGGAIDSCMNPQVELLEDRKREPLRMKKHSLRSTRKRREPTDWTPWKKEKAATATRLNPLNPRTPEDHHKIWTRQTAMHPATAIQPQKPNIHYPTTTLQQHTRRNRTTAYIHTHYQYPTYTIHRQHHNIGNTTP